MADILTPCIRHCTLDPLTDLCVGCGRSLAEIANWQRYTDADRRAIMAVLPARLQAMRPGVPTS